MSQGHTKRHLRYEEAIAHDLVTITHVLVNQLPVRAGKDSSQPINETSEGGKSTFLIS